MEKCSVCKKPLSQHNIGDLRHCDFERERAVRRFLEEASERSERRILEG
jgi:hypothetical protein